MKVKIPTQEEIKAETGEFDDLQKFLENYMTFYGGDNRIAWIDDYDRFLEPTEREDFIEAHPDYENYMVLDRKGAIEERDRLFDQCLDEAYENYVEEMANAYYVARKGKEFLRDKDDDIVFFNEDEKDTKVEEGFTIETVMEAGKALKCGAYKILRGEYK